MLFKRKLIRITAFLFLLAFIYSPLVHATAPNDTTGWWPTQKKPRAIFTCLIRKTTDLVEMNLAQSVSGLAAQALNDGIITEGVWIDTHQPVYARYYKALLKRTALKEAGRLNVWQLAKKYAGDGIIKGYVLYDVKRQDNSVNVATVLAGMKQGILIDLSQEAMAKEMGLHLLADASKKDWDRSLFELLKQDLNPHALVLANPQRPNNRDYAIAHRTMVYFGADSLLSEIVQWVEPLSPVLGWNQGDEFKHIAPCSRAGLINTASDYCLNMPMLSLTDPSALKKIKSLDPSRIHWKENGNFQAFVMSDGDNMQWTMGHFLDNPEYWANPAVAEIPMSFTSCLLNLSMVAKDVYGDLQQSQAPGVSLVEYGGGYYYPDLFAAGRPNRKILQHRFASMVNKQMKASGTKVFGFICRDADSPEAKAMYQVYADEIDDLTGMIAVQYSPYNGGMGAVFWVKNKKGISIPVVTAKYQLWANMPQDNSGNPERIADLMDEQVKEAKTPQLDWTIVHAWSGFKKDPDGKVLDAAKGDKQAQRGVSPVQWTKSLLTRDIRVVSIEELLWRIRMQYHPDETRRLINYQ